jgi:hypothetical protein
MIREELWAELADQKPATVGIVRRRVREDCARNVFVAVSHPNLQRMLILSVVPDAVAGISDPPRTRAVLTTIDTISARGLVDIRVTLTVPDMGKVFSPFVEDVVDAIARASSDAEAVASLLGRFEYWRRLLAAEDPEGLGRAAAQGLYGELWTLRHLVREPVGAVAVEAWTGPTRDDIDFQWLDLALEVKTTIADNPPTVAISNERQLPVDRFDALYLVALSLDALAAGSGESLNDMVDGVMEGLASDLVRFTLRDKLLQYGYADVHRRKYDRPLYSVRELQVFRVEGAFPRLTEGTLPPGVGRVSYTLALNACDAWRSSAEDIKASLRRGAAST